MTFDVGRATVKAWAIAMIVVGFAIMLLELWLHYCHFFTARFCPAENAWSAVGIALSFTLGTFGGLILQQLTVGTALEAIEKLLPSLAGFLTTVVPALRRPTSSSSSDKP